jgi:membrane protein
MSLVSGRAASTRNSPGKTKPGWRKTWWRRLRRVWLALARDNISIMAAGAAYYSMLSIFPAMSALVLTYGLVADPVTIERHLDLLGGILPDEAFKLVADQLHLLVTAPATKLGLGLVLSVLFALWTATSASTAMMNALTVAYDGRERRGLFHFYGLAIALTARLVLFAVVALLLIAGVPALMVEIPEPSPWGDIVPQLRWPLLALFVVLGLGAVYRVAPSRDRPTWDFLRVGTIAASLLWLAGSAAFSFYASHFGSYDRTYGSLGAVAVLLVWLYVTAYVILAGAELNREIGQAEDQAERHLQRQNARTGVPPAPKKGARPQK